MKGIYLEEAWSIQGGMCNSAGVVSRMTAMVSSLTASEAAIPSVQHIVSGAAGVSQSDM